MGVRLSEDEAWERLTASHTGILTTLRKDGRPVSLPIWFVVLDRRIYVRTPERSAKVKRIARDPRGSFLVEAGQSWVELTAVLVQVEARVVDDADEIAAVTAATAAKYEGYGVPAAVPKATSEHYSGMTVVRLDAVEAPVTWDNSRIRLAPAGSAS